jgi:hypothetical protein
MDTAASNDSIYKFLLAVLLLGAIAFIGAFIFVSLSRITYPYALGFMEGGMVDHVSWILAGNKLYGPPSVDFSAFGYSPLYTYLSVGLTMVLGEGFVPLRIISFLATLGAFAILFLMVRRETGSAAAGALAMSLYAATFKASGFWFDMGMVDSLFIFMLLASLYLVRFADTPRKAVVAGLVLAVTFFVKQTALSCSLPILLYLILMHRSLLLYFAVPFGITVAGGIWFLDAIHGGWATFFLFDLYSNAHFRPAYFLSYLKRDLALVDIALLIGVVSLVSKFFWKRDLPGATFYFLVLGATIGLCALALSLSLGAHIHVLMPVHAMISLVFGIGFAEAIASIELASANDPKWRSLSWFLLVACVFQFALLTYRAPDQIPTDKDREAGMRLVEWIRHVDGEVFLPDFGYLTPRAGKKSYVQSVAIQDALSTERTRPYMEKSLLQAIRGDQFEVIILGEEGFTRYPWIEAEVQKYFVLEKNGFFEDPNVFRPVVGYPHRPTKFYRRKSQARTAPAP